jgi:hypothetical protein
MNIFEYAVRNKLRWAFRGYIDVESLFDLSLQDLDTIYKSLSKEINESSGDSLLGIKNKDSKALEIKLEIVKEIFNRKIEEKNKRETAIKNRQERQKLLELIASKKDSELQNKSVEDLMKMLDEIGDE